MLSTLEAVRNAGFAVWAIAPPAGPLAEALAAREIDVSPLAFRDAQGKRLPQSRLREGLARLLAARRPDVLDANSLSMGRLSGPVADELGVPSIAHVRDIVKLSARAVADLGRHRRLLAVSHAARDFHVARGLSAEKTRVLYNGVDLTRFRPRPATGRLHRELHLAREVHLVGTIGQIGLRKGQDVLARAAAELVDALPDVHYVIVGERFSEKAESRRFEAELRAAASGVLRGRVHFLGFRSDVDRILNELALLVHPARQEPLGRVLLEAAAAGVPVIATDVGGTPEIFPSESHSARLIPPDDPETLAVSIHNLIADGPLRYRLALAARRRAEQAFDVRRSAADLPAHYHQVVWQDG